MWFMNRIANPFVRFILRSPFHRLMSGAVLLISYRGRKSGRTYTLPVNYVLDGKTIYMVPGMPDTKTWWRNLRGGAEVTLTLDGKSVGGSAAVLQGTGEATLKALGCYWRRFPAFAQQHGVRMQADGSCNPQDLQKAAASTRVVKVELES